MTKIRVALREECNPFLCTYNFSVKKQMIFLAIS